jgi:hypothetical protein
VLGTGAEAASTTPPTTEPSAAQAEETSALNNLPPAILALLGNAISAEGSSTQAYVNLP